MEILPYFLPCYSSATEVIRLVRDELHTHGYLRYAIDAIFINTSYAAVFLLKLLRPELAEFVDTETILKEVESIVQVFESCSVDDVHTPRLYAGFLKLLLSSRQQSAKGTGFNTSNGQDINVSLDPTLANKLFESQQQIHTTFAHQPALDSAAVNTFGGSVEPMHTQMQMHNIMGAGGAEPSNMSLNTGFNLDQLGQTGFWDNLSMRKLLSSTITACRNTHTYSIMQLASALLLHIRCISQQATFSLAIRGRSACQTLPHRPGQLPPNFPLACLLTVFPTCRLYSLGVVL